MPVIDLVWDTGILNLLLYPGTVYLLELPWWCIFMFKTYESYLRAKTYIHITRFSLATGRNYYFLLKLFCVFSCRFNISFHWCPPGIEALLFYACTVWFDDIDLLIPPSTSDLVSYVYLLSCKIFSNRKVSLSLHNGGI